MSHLIEHLTDIKTDPRVAAARLAAGESLIEVINAMIAECAKTEPEAMRELQESFRSGNSRILFEIVCGASELLCFRGYRVYPDGTPVLLMDMLPSKTAAALH